MKIKKSICIEMLFTEVPFNDRFRLTKESGFDYIEFWSWKDKNVEMIKNLCQTYELKVASFSGDQNFSMIDENQRDDYIAFVEESIKTADFLNCKNLVIHSNALGEEGVVKHRYHELSTSKKILAMLDVLRILAPKVEKADVNLVLEALNTKVDHAGYFLSSSDQAFDIVGFVKSSHIKVLYDIYHMQIMEGNIIDTLRKSIDAIGYIHIADVPGRNEPGTGEINFTTVMKTLTAIKYEGIIGFELTPRQGSQRAINMIQTL